MNWENSAQPVSSPQIPDRSALKNSRKFTGSKNRLAKMFHFWENGGKIFEKMWKILASQIYPKNMKNDGFQNIGKNISGKKNIS